MKGSQVYVIGPGEVGRRLASALGDSGASTTFVSRTQGWDEALGSPDSIQILAMREDDLPAAWRRFPEERRENLVLIQNGFLEACAERLPGNLGAVTRGLIWFTSKGEFFEILRPSLFHGPHASDLSSALSLGGLPAEAIPDRSAFLSEMILKGIWNCVVGLPLAVHETDLSGYLQEHPDELHALVAEASAAASAEYGATVTAEDALQCLTETTEKLGWVRGGAKALPWRNGAIALFGRRHGIPTPTHDRLLQAVGYDPATGGSP